MKLGIKAIFYMVAGRWIKCALITSSAGPEGRGRFWGVQHPCVKAKPLFPPATPLTLLGRVQSLHTDENL